MRRDASLIVGDTAVGVGGEVQRQRVLSSLLGVGGLLLPGVEEMLSRRRRPVSHAGGGVVEDVRGRSVLMRGAAVEASLSLQADLVEEVDADAVEVGRGGARVGIVVLLLEALEVRASRRQASHEMTLVCKGRWTGLHAA